MQAKFEKCVIKRVSSSLSVIIHLGIQVAFLGFGSIGILLPSSPALGLVSAQVHYGIKSNKLTLASGDTTADAVDQSGNSMGVGLDFDLSKVAPIAAGAFYHIDKSKGNLAGVDTVYTATVGGAELLLWAPIPVITPFIKFGYVLFGNAEINENLAGSDIESTLGIEKVTLSGGTPSGYRAALGIAYTIVPTCSLFLNYTMINERSEFTESSLTMTNGTTASSTLSEKLKYTANGRFVGFGIGLSI